MICVYLCDSVSLIAVAASFAILMSAGSSGQGSWLLLSSVFPLVTTEGATWSEYRQLLKPFVEEARSDLSQYAWNQGKYKKMLNRKTDGPESTLGPVWAELVRDEAKFSKVARQLSYEAIISAPLAFSKIVLTKIGLALSDKNAGYSMVPRSFWFRQIESNEPRWERKPREMWLVYEIDRAGYDAAQCDK